MYRSPPTCVKKGGEKKRRDEEQGTEGSRALNSSRPYNPEAPSVDCEGKKMEVFLPFFQK